MTIALELRPENVSHLLEGLLRRDVDMTSTETIDVHPLTIRGLVNNEDQLVGAIGSDLRFAHNSGAALAMVPAGVVAEEGDEPNNPWLEFYHEVANVLSRAVNQAAPERVRIDPGIAHSEAALAGIMEAGAATIVHCTVSGYGPGTLGIWSTI